MQEIPRFDTFITRPGLDSLSVQFDTSNTDVRYTSEWESVSGAKGVTCHTWTLEGGDEGVDGADIVIEAGGYTPIQCVNVADVVVDIPESGEAYCVMMDLNGDVHVEHFNDAKKGQMVWNKGMIITWIAVTEVRLTEFESPSFHNDMFITVPDDTAEYTGRSLAEFNSTVAELRKKVSQ